MTISFTATVTDGDGDQAQTNFHLTIDANGDGKAEAVDTGESTVVVKETTTTLVNVYDEKGEIIAGHTQTATTNTETEQVINTGILDTLGKVYGDSDVLQAANDQGYVLKGGAGADELYGGSQNDTLLGGSGDDFLRGGKGSDSIDGGGGGDTASYDDHSEDVDANLQTDKGITGNDVDDLVAIEHLIGGSGNDKLTGDGGDNRLTGGRGSDTLIGGGGNDTASYADHNVAVNANLTTGAATATQTNGTVDQDVLTDINNLIGGSQDDTLIGNNNSNVISGGTGNDTIVGLGATIPYVGVQVKTVLMLAMVMIWCLVGAEVTLLAM